MERSIYALSFVVWIRIGEKIYRSGWKQDNLLIQLKYNYVWSCYLTAWFLETWRKIMKNFLWREIFIFT